MIKYVKGDLFASIDENNTNKILIPHCCNDIGVMAAGFVVALAAFNKAPKECYLDWFNHPNHKQFIDQRWNSSVQPALGECQIVACCSSDGNKSRTKVGVVNMIGQHGVSSVDNRVPVKYWALSKAMCFIRDKIINGNLKVDEIRAPKFGSKLAGGKWDIIEVLINEVWIDSNIPVTIYEL